MIWVKSFEGKRCRKIALNGRMSMIENFLKNLGTNLKRVLKLLSFVEIRQKLKALLEIVPYIYDLKVYGNMQAVVWH